MKLTNPILVLSLALFSGLGCSSDDTAGDPSASHDTGAADTTSGALEALVVRGPIEHIDDLAREPMVIERGGTLFVTGYGSQVSGLDPNAVPNLWRSTDQARTFTRVDVGSSEDGAAGNSDVDLAVAPDGTLYFLTMGFDRSKGEGTHIAVGVSHDFAATWTWTRLSEDRFDDRPWIDVAPDGTAHVIWNDGAGVSYAVSTDDGRTFTERERIHDKGGSSHLDVGPNGEIAVRITPLSASGNIMDEGVELIAISNDGGTTWSKHEIPGEREWDPTFTNQEINPRWVEPVAWDDEGSLYLLWGEGSRVMLALSRDQGATWKSFEIADDGEMAYFPYLIARNEGELAATWFTGTGDTLTIRLATLHMSIDDQTPPEVRRAEPFVADAWLESETPTRTPAGEYVPVTFLERGGLGVVTPIQNPAQDRWGFAWWQVDG